MPEGGEWAPVVLQILGGLFAAVTAARVWKAWRFIQSASLRRFAAGFSLLAASQGFVALLTFAALTAGDTIPRDTFDAFDAFFWAHYVTLVLGLGAVFWSFGRHPFRWTPAVAGILIWAGPALEFLSVVLLFFIVLHAGLNHIARAGGGSGRVAIGFFFLFAAHILAIANYVPLQPRTVEAELVNLVGFAVLLLSVVRARPEPVTHA